jgi:hypothetical protein
MVYPSHNRSYIEELQEKTKMPGREIVYNYESINIHQADQLNIIIKNNFWDFKKVFYCCFQTAYLAESITKSYSRIFLSLLNQNIHITVGQLLMEDC